MSTNIEAALDEAGKVVKKQKLCASKVDEALDKLISLAKDARQKAAKGSGDSIKDLLARAEKLGIVKDMNSSTKELHSSISKLSKVWLLQYSLLSSYQELLWVSLTSKLPSVAQALDKTFDNSQDICKAFKDIQLDQQLVNKASGA